MARVQASVLVPSMFIAHEPQMPSRQERRKVSVGSISFLILISASRTIGPHASRSTSYVSTRGFMPSSGFQRYTLNARTRFAPAGAGKCLPGWTFEFFGNVNSAICASSINPLLRRDDIDLAAERVHVHGAVVDAGVA